ncbi:DNA/RNA helicase [Microbacterium sp. CGR1]|uniref:DUF559 domain-containing protein n=1 Tax=Microbacterium sp. CGR1 TaxID=1696072 RepID=UPI00069E18B8|nr:DUF559 domain-containing protein [Microbacterium sp. CGR1]AKV85024.1 DNA/RNA helicase [Microbacterium sp. CGR1]
MKKPMVDAARGAARVRDLLVTGVSRYAIGVAVDRGELIRVRKGWVAARDADPLLIAAARDGVILTCVTQATRRGLWDVGLADPHVAAPPHAGHIAVSGHVHWEKPAVPRVPGTLEDPIENVLAIVARCQSRDTALSIWNSALHRGLVDLDMLRRLPLTESGRALIDEATPFSDSGLESVVVPRLRWLDLPLRRQTWIAGHRVDLLIGECLVLQIDGGHHVGMQRTRDIEHDARVMLLGYHVIRVGYDQVMNRWAEVQDVILRAVAQGLHRRG